MCFPRGASSGPVARSWPWSWNRRATSHSTSAPGKRSRFSSGEFMSTMVAGTDKDAYLSSFERLEKELGKQDRPALQRLRRAAITRFSELGFPTSRNEDWKFTHVAPLVRVSFEPARPGSAHWPLQQ